MVDAGLCCCENGKKLNFKPKCPRGEALGPSSTARGKGFDLFNRSRNRSFSAGSCGKERRVSSPSAS
ncbi:hypothetical protein EYF80_010227 [Liparis tanakae]|uniref:Uncharacterized protein n=1 Tax=Liparis tanakae TaxID=230148 RepID=A0A4Z2IP16_9TELE|nr:hypothetical protein EYF80_010227 [Liparis tanakae]